MLLQQNTNDFKAWSNQADIWHKNAPFICCYWFKIFYVTKQLIVIKTAPISLQDLHMLTKLSHGFSCHRIDLHHIQCLLMVESLWCAIILAPWTLLCNHEVGTCLQRILQCAPKLTLQVLLRLTELNRNPVGTKNDFCQNFFSTFAVMYRKNQFFWRPCHAIHYICLNNTLTI